MAWTNSTVHHPKSAWVAMSGKHRPCRAQQLCAPGCFAVQILVGLHIVSIAVGSVFGYCFLLYSYYQNRSIIIRHFRTNSRAQALASLHLTPLGVLLFVVTVLPPGGLPTL